MGHLVFLNDIASNVKKDLFIFVHIYVNMYIYIFDCVNGDADYIRRRQNQSYAIQLFAYFLVMNTVRRTRFKSMA